MRKVSASTGRTGRNGVLHWPSFPYSAAREYLLTPMSSYQPPSVTCHDSSEVLSLSGASQESKDEESVSVYFNPSPPLLLRMPRCRSLLWSSLTTGLALAVVLVVGVTSDLVIGWVLVSFFPAREQRSRRAVAGAHSKSWHSITLRDIAQAALLPTSACRQICTIL